MQDKTMWKSRPDYLLLSQSSSILDMSLRTVRNDKVLEISIVCECIHNHDIIILL